VGQNDDGFDHRVQTAIANDALAAAYSKRSSACEAFGSIMDLLARDD